MMSLTKNKSFVSILIVALLVTVTVGYLRFLELSFPKRGFFFEPGWTDFSFQTQYDGVAWMDFSFDSGWIVSTISNSGNNTAGFKAEGSIGTLYASFAGYNYANERGITGVTIMRSVESINTTLFPYFTINYLGTTQDFALAFSFDFLTSQGTWRSGGPRHISALSQNLCVDLRRIYNGTIESISLSFTNDYDPTYTGGLQKVHIQRIVISKSVPQWTPAYNRPVNASISDQDGILRVYGRGKISVDTSVSAQRFVTDSVNLTTYRYLKVSVKSSSIDAAARIVVWTSQSNPKVVLLKTYNDNDWHTEIIDLTFFSLGNSLLYEVELGWTQLRDAYESVIYFRQLSLNSLEAES